MDVDAIFRDLVQREGLSERSAAQRLTRNYGAPQAEVDAARAQWQEDTGRIRSIADPLFSVGPKVKARETWYAGVPRNAVYWPLVKKRLSEKLPAAAVQSVDDASDRIVSLLNAPGTVDFTGKGLVLGYVQSGKTTNFISVLAKAVDVGYRIIIVLSGLTNNLRDQTQERLEDMVFDPSDDAVAWHRLTTVEGETNFDTTNATSALINGTPLIGVVKKNPVRLKRLASWLKTVPKNKALLLIDDEADQGSIDVGRARRSQINSLLLKLMRHPRTSYIAYSATPFANLLINPEDQNDLYPSDFCVALDKPSGYFGATELFGSAYKPEDLTQSEADSSGTDGMDVIRTISADEAQQMIPPRREIASWEPSAGSSLHDAMRWFLLSSAARRVRGKGNPHCTMLVHNSMLTEAHEKLAPVLEHELKVIRAGLHISDPALLAELESLYTNECSRVPASDFGHTTIPFADVLSELSQLCQACQVIVDNSRSDNRLSYTSAPDSSPTTAIVVGGNTLSRGLTLEGLSTSYFVRSASAYDTLLQMGRWFGYRGGYEDLCRIWMTDELRRWFRDLAGVEEELRTEIRDEMEVLTPSDIALKIRTHPDLSVTSAAKMRSSITSSMSYSGRMVQTVVFKRTDKETLDHNIEAVRHLVDSVLRQTHSKEDTFASRGLRGFARVPSSLVIAFFKEYLFHERVRTLSSDYLERYIRQENSAGALREWDIVFIEPEKSQRNAQVDAHLSRPVRTVVRSRLSGEDPADANIKALASQLDRIADFGKPTDRNVATSKDYEVLRLRETNGVGEIGLLCLYFIDKDSEPRTSSIGSEQQQANRPRRPLEAAQHIVGLMLQFPQAKSYQSEVSYVAADLSPQLHEVSETEQLLTELDSNEDV